MKVYKTSSIRNIAVVGHGDAGKTQLVSSLLHIAGATQRWGKVDEGTTVTDYEEDSIARKITLNSALAHLEFKETKVNLMDTPGYAAFIAHAKPAIRVSECALVVVDAVNHVGVQTEKCWSYAEEYQKPRLVVINKLDKERGDFDASIESARTSLSTAVIPFTLPLGKERNFKGVVDVVHMRAYEFDETGKSRQMEIPAEVLERAKSAREQLVEAVAESDDALMEKFFDQGTLDDSDLLPNIPRAIAAGRVFPAFAASSINLVGLQNLLEAFVEFIPSPEFSRAEVGKPNPESDGEVIERAYDPAKPFSAYVFRTIADPFAGRITVIKIISGHLHHDATVSNCSRGTLEKVGALNSIQGKHLEKVEDAYAGDIIALVKLRDTQTGDTLCDKAASIVYTPVEFPEPAIAFAIEPKSRHDEEKISVALHKILEEDPALSFTRDPQTKEFLLAGTGQLHVETVIEKLKKKYTVEVALHPPKVPYKETITARAEVQGRHKKQSGGRGQFGDCKVLFEPLPRGSGFVFEDKIFGGSIPQQFRPAVHGAIAGYPLVDFKVVLIDGSYHTVDSDEHSFRAAGRKAFRAAMEKVRPTLLEPVMMVEVVTPQECSGDIMGDLNSRRGRVQGMDTKGNQQLIKAQVPMSEMLNYQSTLNSITGARGSYHMEFDHYDLVPAQIAHKIVDQAKAEGRIRAEEEE
jgi:elongation factor G